MVNEIESKTYELAYHLTPDMEEADVKAHAQELSDLISQNGGSVVTSNQPRQIHLSYPVKGKQYAHFGLINFTAPSETIEKLNAQMKLQNGVLRFLLLKEPREGKELRILGKHWSRPTMKEKLLETTAQEKAPVAQKPEEKKAEGEVMEKEIEKVIEGL